jgi:4-hydroxy-4-methyl-2-oxoglutarate aldolase
MTKTRTTTKTKNTPATITLEIMRAELYSAVLSDALDALGHPNQSPRVQLPPLTGVNKIVGRCKTTLWVDMAHADPKPYDLELKAVDGCRPDDVLIAAAGGSMRSGIRGELLSTAARNSGCVGGRRRRGGARRGEDARDAVSGLRPRHVRVRQPQPPARRRRGRDGGNRRGALGAGDLVIADVDGVVVCPRAVEAEAVRRAWEKVHAENVTRDAIKGGMKALAAYEKYGVL